MVTLVVIVLASLFSVFAVHEGGHVLVARALGGTARVRWWPTPRTIARLPGDLSRRKEAMYFLGGPLANLAFALVLVLLFGRVGAIGGLVHLLFASFSLLPTSWRNDGARAWALLRRG